MRPLLYALSISMLMLGTSAIADAPATPDAPTAPAAAPAPEADTALGSNDRDGGGPEEEVVAPQQSNLLLAIIAYGMRHARR